MGLSELIQSNYDDAYAQWLGTRHFHALEGKDAIEVLNKTEIYRQWSYDNYEVSTNYLRRAKMLLVMHLNTSNADDHQLS